MTSIILTLLLIIGAGWLFRRFGVVGEGAEKAFNQYLYYLALPCLIIVKIGSTPLSGLGWDFLVANLLPLVICMAGVWTAWRFFGLDWSFARLLLIVSVMGNTVYLGFPVVSMRLGEHLIGHAAIISSLHNVIVFTLGFALMSTICAEGGCPPSRLLRIAARNVVLWASLAGLALAASGWRLPGLAESVMSAIGGTTMPLSLFTIGITLYGKSVAGNLCRLSALSGVKLLVLPAIYLAAARFLGFSGEISAAVFLQMTMPVAVLNYVVAREFDFDADLVAQSIVLSTLLFFPLLYLYELAL
ncbi:MAG: putative permease [Elusimicrobia bacterium]|nr:MAG: putative permease [Elusimicrobiota bacterium]KAF0158434.1 MAG: putative permease [Elusimicrobiota bacterium]